MPLVHKITGDIFERTIEAVSAGRLSDPEKAKKLTELDKNLERSRAHYFYLGVVYPMTGLCVIIMSHQTDKNLEGCATPFDSGGIWKLSCLPGSASNRIQYLREHEVGISDVREYFTLHLDAHFESAHAYIDGPPSLAIDDCGKVGDMKLMDRAFEIRHEAALDFNPDTRIYIDEAYYPEYVAIQEDAHNIGFTPNVEPVAKVGAAARKYVKELLRKNAP